MNKDQFLTYLQGLTKKVCQEPCPGILGLDLCRGALINSQSVLNAFPLQVFGEDIFLRNMMQRFLEADLVQRSRRSPILIIIPDNKEGILHEINKIFENPAPYGTNTLLFYNQGRSGRSVSLERALKLFEYKMQAHLCVELEVKYHPLNNPVLTQLGNHIKEKFGSEIITHFMPDRPFIYLFCPEDMGTQDHVHRYIEELKEHASFRIFSKNPNGFFENGESGLVYGPNLYPIDVYEKMRRRSYWELEQKRKWDKKNNFYGDSEDSKILGWVKALVAGVAVDKTAFGRFRVPYERGYEHYWFYPVPQSLGQLPYRRPLAPQEDSVSSLKAAPQIHDPVLNIIEDLKPQKSNL